MDFNEFLINYNKVLSNKEEFIREGQALMNYLGDVWKDEYNRITATDIDCFYNDKIINKTLEHLENTWKNRKNEI